MGVPGQGAGRGDASGHEVSASGCGLARRSWAGKCELADSPSARAGARQNPRISMAGLRPFTVRRRSTNFLKRLGTRTCPPVCWTCRLLRPKVRTIERMSAAWTLVAPRRLWKFSQPSSVTVICVGIFGSRT